MIIGGGSADMRASLNLADEGFRMCFFQAISAIGRESTPRPKREDSHRINGQEANDDG